MDRIYEGGEIMVGVFCAAAAEGVKEIAKNANDIFPKDFDKLPEVKDDSNFDEPVSKKNLEGTSELEHLITRNESLDGDVHPITGVPFEEKCVEVSPGHYVEGVFPNFESQFDAQLPKELYQETDRMQFNECNEQLKTEVDKNPDLKSEFTEEQQLQIANGDTPDGYVWHHDAELGKMQLVDFETHANTGHTGGKAVWGGGNENR